MLPIKLSFVGSILEKKGRPKKVVCTLNRFSFFLVFLKFVIVSPDGRKNFLFDPFFHNFIDFWKKLIFFTCRKMKQENIGNLLTSKSHRQWIFFIILVLCFARQLRNMHFVFSFTCPSERPWQKIAHCAILFISVNFQFNCNLKKFCKKNIPNIFSNATEKIVFYR